MSQKKKQRLIIRTVILLVLISAVAYTLYANLTKDSRGEIKVGDKAPDFVLQDMSGTKHRLSDYRGKGIFLNFWGTWCGPCKEEMPYMVDLYKDFKKQGVEILAVNVGESNYLVNKFIKEYGLNFPVLMDKGRDVQYAYGIDPIPTSFFIDSSGKVKQIVVKTMTKKEIQHLMESIKP